MKNTDGAKAGGRRHSKFDAARWIATAPVLAAIVASRYDDSLHIPTLQLYLAIFVVLLLLSPDAIELVLPGLGSFKLSRSFRGEHSEQPNGQPVTTTQQITVINEPAQSVQVVLADTRRMANADVMLDSDPPYTHLGDDAQLEQQFLLLCEELEPWARFGTGASEGLRTPAPELTTPEAQAVWRWQTIFNDELGAVLTARDAVANPPPGLVPAETRQAFEIAKELQGLLSEGRRQAAEANREFATA